MFERYVKGNWCVITPLVLLLCWASLAHAVPRGLIPEESQIEFTVKGMGVPITGKFKKFDAAIDIDLAKLDNASAAIRIDIGSLTTENEEADAIAVGADWLDKSRAPLAIFQSTSIRALGAGRYEAKGSLNIKHVARPITLQFASAELADGKTMITSEFKINRSEFGIGAGVWNQGGVVAEVISVKAKMLLSTAGAKVRTIVTR